jgi:hypothetical protein
VHRLIVALSLLCAAGCGVSEAEIAVTGGTMFVEKYTGKWSGSDGNKTLSGKIVIQLSDGRTLEGTFAVHAVTWG